MPDASEERLLEVYGKERDLYLRLFDVVRRQERALIERNDVREAVRLCPEVDALVSRIDELESSIASCKEEVLGKGEKSDKLKSMLESVNALLEKVISVQERVLSAMGGVVAACRYAGARSSVNERRAGKVYGAES